MSDSINHAIAIMWALKAIFAYTLKVLHPHFGCLNSNYYQVAVTICQSFTSLKATINMVWHPADALRRLLFKDRNLLRIKLIEN